MECFDNQAATCTCQDLLPSRLHALHPCLSSSSSSFLFQSLLDTGLGASSLPEWLLPDSCDIRAIQFWICHSVHSYPGQRRVHAKRCVRPPL